MTDTTAKVTTVEQAFDAILRCIAALETAGVAIPMSLHQAAIRLAHEIAADRRKPWPIENDRGELRSWQSRRCTMTRKRGWRGGTRCRKKIDDIGYERPTTPAAPSMRGRRSSGPVTASPSCRR
jgi:hypothetical protein